MTTLPEPPRSALVDPATGRPAREWVRFFDDLRRAIVTGLDDAVGGRLEALELDALFGAGAAQVGTGADYNDAAVRARLDALETEMLFPDPEHGAADDLGDTLAALAALAGDAALEAAFAPLPDPAVGRRLAALELGGAFAPDPNAGLRALSRRVADLELAQALPDETAGRLASLARRVAALDAALTDLQTEELFQ